MLEIFKKNWYLTGFILILVLAAFLRFPFLAKFPPSMIQDEVGIGYSAMSIAETGKDEWGISYPMVFKSFGDYKAPVFIYTTAVLYKIIGWQEVLPRITSAIAGLFIVLVGTLWIKSEFKSKKFGLIAGFLLAINPWTINMSRLALESNLGLAFFFAGLLFLSYSKKSVKYIFPSAVFFSLSTYTFHSFRYAVFLFFAGTIVALILFKFRELKKQIPVLKIFGLVLVLSTLFSLPGFTAKGATSRLDQTLLFTSDKHIKLYEHYENNCHNTFITIDPRLTVLCRLQYNKISRLLLIGSDSLIQHLSPGFYFFSGDTEAVRNPTSSGQFYPLLFPLWMIGILLIAKKYKEHLEIIVGYGVAVLPSLVSGTPHATRLSIIIPFFIFTFIVGYQFLIEYFKKNKFFTPVFIAVFLILTGLHMVKYAAYTFAGHEITATYLSYAKKVAKLSYEYVEKGYTVYADHDLYPEPHVYYAYFNQIPPQLTQEAFAQVYEESAGFSRPKQFGKHIFFESFNTGSVDCNKIESNPIVVITNDKNESLSPTKIIKDNTELYELIYVYDLGQVCQK